MSPTLALTLSFEGIGLLTRVDGGWHLLDEVGLDSPDLAGDLARLRDMGAEHSGGTFATLLVVPNDQIKVLSLDLGRMRAAKMRAEVTRVLEEQTPYTAEQLIFDTQKVQKQTQVAAVAKETLAEAEAFASDHDFNPVWFTAMPDPAAYAGAPDFGPTTRGASAKVTFDGTAMVIVGKGPLPAPQEEPAPIPAQQAVADPSDTAPSHDTETEQPTPQSEELAPPEAPAEQPDLPPEPPVAFSSRRQSTANADAPKLGGARRDADPSALDGGQTAPRLNAELRFDPARVVAGLKADVTAPDIPDGDTGRSKKKKSGSFFAARRANNEADRSEPSVPTTAPAQADDSPETTLVTAPPGDVTAERNDRKKEKDQEKARMTVFGSRQSEVRGKPRYLGLVLTTLLLVFLALVALWATYFVEDGVAGLFGTDDDVIVLEQQASHPATPELRETEPLASEAAPTAVETAEPLISEEPELEIAAIDPDDLSTETLPPTSTDTITDSAEIEALLDAEGPLTLTESEANAHYAVTGIWQKAPEAPLDIESASSEEIYLPSIDVSIRALDAFALQSEQALATDLTPKAQNNPPPLGATFAFDERGLVVATPEGTMTPDGVLVFAGRPPLEPASYPKRINVAQALAEAADSRLADVRPRLRPSNLVENNQRATLGGLTLNELATIRPKLRPENVKTAEETNTAPTALAVTTSVRPRAKPANIAQLAQRATASVTEVAAVPAAASITPSIPTTASVARQATIQNAINLKKINLIGVYGTASNRRALVRLSSGRYKKVQVGDRIDGGKVAAIGEGELRYIKSGKNITLKMPKG